MTSQFKITHFKSKRSKSQVTKTETINDIPFP